MSTSRIFQLGGEGVVCPPTFFDGREFYLSLDPDFLVERFRAELAYLHRYWFGSGRPTLTVFLTRTLLESSEDALLGLMSELRSGVCSGVPVKLAPLGLLRQTATLERIDDLHDFRLSPPPSTRRRAARTLRFSRRSTKPLSLEAELALELLSDPATLRTRLTASRNLYEQAEILTILAQRFGLEHPLDSDETVENRLKKLYTAAGELRLWAVIRRTAGLLGKVDVALSDSLTDLLVRQKTVTIGRAYSRRSLITRPLPESELLAKIREFCRDDIRDRVLTQELIVYLGLLIRVGPGLFRGFLSIRLDHLILLLVSDLAQHRGLTQDEAYEALMHEPPSQIRARLRLVLGSYHAKELTLKDQEAIQGRQSRKLRYTVSVPTTPAVAGSWWTWRKCVGALSLVPDDFYANVWHLMSRCHGLVIGEKLEHRNRLESRAVLSEMTTGETKFALRIEHLLNRIPTPEYRQLSIEALSALADLFAQNTSLIVEDHLVLDVIIGHAVRLAYLGSTPTDEAHYEENKAAAWAGFYELSTVHTSAGLVASFRYLLESGSRQLEHP